MTLAEIKVSVPLRGCSFEIILRQRIKLQNVVSVPLRGCSFEIYGFRRKGSCWLFPSPCGDVVLK